MWKFSKATALTAALTNQWPEETCKVGGRGWVAGDKKIAVAIISASQEKAVECSTFGQELPFHCASCLKTALCSFHPICHASMHAHMFSAHAHKHAESSLAGRWTVLWHGVVLCHVVLRRQGIL